LLDFSSCGSILFAHASIFRQLPNVRKVVVSGKSALRQKSQIQTFDVRLNERPLSMLADAYRYGSKVVGSGRSGFDLSEGEV
jgi:hypothetical protein